MVRVVTRHGETRHAVAYFPGEGTVRLTDPPVENSLGPRDVMVRTRFVGLCGTDREVVRADTAWLPDGGDYLVLGHELVGEVVQVGDKVDGLADGEPVTAMVRDGCGTCPTCTIGRADNCLSGGFREYGIRGLHGFARPLVTIPSALTVPIDRSFGVHGVLVEPLSVVEKAVELARLARQRLGLDGSERWRVLVIGCGTVGLLTTALLRLHGQHVVAVDRRSQQHAAAQLACRLGAEYVRVEPEDALADLSRDFDVAFEASGDAAAALAVHDHLAIGGVQIQLGVALPSRSVTIDGGRRVHDDTARQLQVIGTANAARQHFTDAAVDLRALLGVDGFPEIVTSIHPPGQFDRALWADADIKTVLAFDRAEQVSCR